MHWRFLNTYHDPKWYRLIRDNALEDLEQELLLTVREALQGWIQQSPKPGVSFKRWLRRRLWWQLRLMTESMQSRLGGGEGEGGKHAGAEVPPLEADSGREERKRRKKQRMRLRKHMTHIPMPGISWEALSDSGGERPAVNGSTDASQIEGWADYEALLQRLPGLLPWYMEWGRSGLGSRILVRERQRAEGNRRRWVRVVRDEVEEGSYNVWYDQFVQEIIQLWQAGVQWLQQEEALKINSQDNQESTLQAQVQEIQQAVGKEWSQIEIEMRPRGTQQYQTIMEMVQSLWVISKATHRKYRVRLSVQEIP